MSAGLDATFLLDAAVIDDPYPFYRRLLAEAPVWRVPGTSVVVISSFELVNEAVARVADFSSNMKCLLYKDEDGLPQQLSFGDLGQQTLATADPPEHAIHRKTVFPDLVAKRMVSLEPYISDLAASCVGRRCRRGRPTSWPRSATSCRSRSSTTWSGSGQRPGRAPPGRLRLDRDAERRTGA